MKVKANRASRRVDRRKGVILGAFFIMCDGRYEIRLEFLNHSQESVRLRLLMLENIFGYMTVFQWLRGGIADSRLMVKNSA